MKHKNGSKKRLTVGLGLILLLIILAGALWWNLPKHFLHGIDVADIAEIQVTDGNNGTVFTISDREDITQIVESIQSTPMKKTGCSVAYSGYRFRMRFINEEGKLIESFILNADTCIRKDPFFYQSEEATLPYEILDAYSKSVHYN